MEPEHQKWKAAVMAGEIELEDIDVKDHKRLAVTDVIGAGGHRLSQAQLQAKAEQKRLQRKRGVD